MTYDRLTKQLLHDTPADISQTKITHVVTADRVFMVETRQAEDRCLQIMEMDRILTVFRKLRTRGTIINFSRPAAQKQRPHDRQSAFSPEDHLPD